MNGNVQNDQFLAQYSQFYIKADKLADSLKKSDFPTRSPEAQTKNETLALQTITAFHHLLFGLDESLKSKAVKYGKGALEIILSLVESIINDTSQANEIKEAIKLEALKAIKCCVVRCSIGRNRCRGAGVFRFLKSMLENDADNEVLMDQTLTVLAAISLNNDLNALQVFIEMKPNIMSVTASHSNSTQIQKVATYLNALFDAVSSEQRENGKIHSSPQFFNRIRKGQQYEIQADAILTSIVDPENRDINAENKYTDALKEFSMANSGDENVANEELSMIVLEKRKIHPLLKYIVGSTYRKRSACRYATKKYDDAIQDASKAILCLEGSSDDVELAEKIKIQSLVDAKDTEAEQEIAKAKLFVKDISFLDQMLEKLSMN